MMKMARQVGTWALLFALLVIFVLPAFAVQPTALRAARAAHQLMMGFAFPAMLVVIRATVPSPCDSYHDPALEGEAARCRSVIDLTCSRLC